MQHKDITMAPEAQDALRKGVDKLANVVKSTLGPGGTNVILQRGDTQAITKDGVSVAREIYLEDEIENIGAQIVKQAAENTVREAGDGTTTATVLAQAIFNQGLKHMKSGAKLIDVKRGIDMAVEEVVKHIKSNSNEVKGDDITRVALISANGDKLIGGLVGEAISEVGLEGLVTVDDSKSLDTYRKKIEGMQWNRGYMHHAFINRPEKMECYLENPLVIIYDGNINSFREVMGNDKYNIIQRVREGNDPEIKGLPFLFICNDAGAEFLAAVGLNMQRGAWQTCVVQPPEFQDTRKAIMHDIAAMTGATVIGKDSGLQWKDVKPEHLGRADAVRVTGWSTTIIGGRGGLKASVRAQEIREQINENANEHAVAVLRSRLARLINGLNVIYVGGATEAEIAEKKDRIDDSINATRAALEEGVLPGGGIAYVRAKRAIDFSALPYENGDQRLGAQIVQEALDLPFNAIVENIGETPDVPLREIVSNENYSFGYNAQTRKHENLVESGVIDPTKVVRLALINGASVAGMLLSTKAIVSNSKPVRQ